MSSKINYQSILRELLIVFFGVLIAMLLNSWNEKRQEKIQAQNYLNGIYEEIDLNIKILEKGLVYHQSILEGLEMKPTETNLSLNPSMVTNFAWKLAENNVFKENVNKDIYRKLAAAYQMHDFLMGIQINAGDRMSEVNILSPYYMIGATNQNPSEADKKEFFIGIQKSWIPVFESWTGIEKRYLDLLLEIVKEN